MNIKAMLKALFAVTAWGASFVATKISLQYAAPTTIVWIRFTMGMIILGLAARLSKQFALPQGKDWGYFALLGFLGITFHQWLQSTGLVTAQATTSAWIVATIPVFMALLGLFLLKEYLNWYQVIGILLAAFGVLLVVTKGNVASIFTGKFGTSGDFLVLISAPNWAVFSTLSRSGLKRHPATLMMFYVMSFGWLFTSILFFLGSGTEQILHIPGDGWLALTFLGIICSGIAYIFWYELVKEFASCTDRSLPLFGTGHYGDRCGTPSQGGDLAGVRNRRPHNPDRRMVGEQEINKEADDPIP